MGQSTSAVARATGATAARRYPSRPSPSTQTAPAQATAPAKAPADLGPTVHPDAVPKESRDQAIPANASDPVLASKLRQIGPVAANPYQSHTATTQPASSSRPRDNALPQFPSQQEPPPGLFPSASAMRNNPALLILQARQRLRERADKEMEAVGRSGFEGREFMDVFMISDALRMRRQGRTAEEIERRMGLKKGTVERLGERGVLEPAYG